MPDFVSENSPYHIPLGHIYIGKQHDTYVQQKHHTTSYHVQVPSHHVQIECLHTCPTKAPTSTAKHQQNNRHQIQASMPNNAAKLRDLPDPLAPPLPLPLSLPLPLPVPLALALAAAPPLHMTGIKVC